MERVLEMVSNETNFCSENYSGKLRTALEGVQLYLESFAVARDAQENGNEEEEE